MKTIKERREGEQIKLFGEEVVKARDLLTLVEGLRKLAFEVFERDGEWELPSWFIHSKSGELKVVSTPHANPRSEAQKSATDMHMRELLRSDTVVRYVHVAEVWIGQTDDQMLGKASGKKEAIWLSGEEKMTGEQLCLTLYIDRTSGKAILKDDPDGIRNDETAQGRFVHMFVPAMTVN